jgi:hypothetical protein
LIEAADLARCLWKPFLGDIAKGGPVYFTFSAELVRTLLSEQGHTTGDPVLEVCEAARQLYFIAGNDAVLREYALDVGASGRSLAIILVCQQVLAVESMVRDPKGFSENAYFPRLRRLMSPLFAEISNNPFDFAEFEAIWRALARDIRSVAGSTDASITFRFGVESGVNKARAFPLSQALLTLEDLRVISMRGKHRLQNASLVDIWRVLKQLRYHLSRRARRLIDLGVFRDRVADQVSSYLKVADAGLPRREEVRARLTQLDITVFRDTSDWLEPVYRAYLRAPDSLRDHDEARIQAELAQRIAGAPFLTLPLAELGDSWLCSNRAMTIQPGECFLVVTDPLPVSDIERRLRQHGIDSAEVPDSEGAAGKLGPYLVTPRRLAAGTSQISVRNGRASSVDGGSSPTTYHWRGGLAVDPRGSKFLRDYLPTHIDFSGSSLLFEQLESVNGRYMTADSFKSSLASMTDDSAFDIGFPDGRAARLSVAISRLPKEPQVGHPVRADGTLDIGLVGVTTHTQLVSGFCETPSYHVPGFDVRSCALLLRALRVQAGEEMSPASVAKIRLRLQASNIPTAVRDVVLRLLVKEVRLPSQLCVTLGIN